MRNTKRIKSTFMPGSDWLYIKLYCGVSVSNEILISKIKPASEKLIEEKKLHIGFLSDIQILKII